MVFFLLDERSSNIEPIDGAANGRTKVKEMT
jgi:hypothetical protein